MTLDKSPHAVYSVFVKIYPKVKFQEALRKRGVVEHPVWIRSVLVILGVSCIFWWGGITTVYAERWQIPYSDVERALLAKQWKPEHIKFIYNKTLAYYETDSRYFNPVSYGSFFDYCGQSLAKRDLILVVPGRLDTDANIEHEYKHAWDHRTCTWETDNVKSDFESLGLPESVYLLGYTNDLKHYNHTLIRMLRWKYNLLPQWYLKKWYGYIFCVTNICSSPLTQRAYIPMVNRNGA